MTSEMITTIIGLVGIVIGAIPTYLFMRQKSLAEIDKLKAEADKTKAEAEKIRADLKASSLQLPTMTSALAETKLSDFILSGYPDFTEQLNSASRISILSSSLSSIAIRYYSNFEQFLQRGGSLRVVVSDTIEKIISLQVYRAASMHDPQKIRELIENHIGVVKQLGGKALQPDKLQIRLMPYLPPFSITIMEFSHGNSIAYVKLLTIQKTEHEQPTLVFDEATNKKWYEYFQDQFERFWNAPNRKVA